jgi:hypothetical protein
MKKYWRDLGVSYGSMSKPLRLLFTLMCSLPSVLIMPLLWYLASLPTSTLAQLNLLNAAKAGGKLEPAAFMTLMTELFSSVPSFQALMMAILAVSGIGNVVFLLVHFAGVMAKRSDQAASEASGVAAEA